MIPERVRLRILQAWQNGFIRSVSVLVGGTAFAQALMVLILPILTRLYSPSDFATLAVYASILGILGSIACLRLEIAIPLPESDEDALNLLALSLLSAASFGVLAWLIILLTPPQMVSAIGGPELAEYIWLVPLGVWLSGSYTALQYWSTRKKNFSLIAKTRISQATCAASVQVGFGVLYTTSFGLLFGQLISSSAGAIALGVRLAKDQKENLKNLKLERAISTLSRYKRFPKYSTLEALTNSGSIQIPILIIAALAIGPEAGFLMLATRVMAAPMSLIGGAISQVYLSRAPEEMRKGQLASFTANVIGGLLKTGVGPLLFAGITAPFLFPIIFGEDWGRAGEIVSWITPWLALQFITSPISMLLHVTENHKKALTLQTCGLIIRTGAVLLSAYFLPNLIVEIYSISGAVFYLIYFAVIIRVSGINLTGITSQIKNSWKPVASWVIPAILITSILVKMS